MDTPLPQLTPEQLALLPHDDRGAALNGVSWFLTALATVFLCLRVYCKVLGRRGLWWDDWILILSWVLLLIDSALVTALVLDFGFGKHSWDFAPPSIDRFYLIVQVRATITITAIVWTKTAFALTLLRLTDGWTKRLLYAIIVSMNIAMGLSAMLNWVQCQPLAKAWNITMPGTCWDPRVLTYYSMFSSAYSAAMDFILALLPWKLIWGLQMKKKEKFGVAIAMSMGIFAGITAIVKTVKLPKLASGDLYDAADLVQWDITETAVTMIAACIPLLRILIREARDSTRRYYHTGALSRTTKPGDAQTWTGSDGPAGNKTSRATISGRSFHKGDDQSDKSILDSEITLVKPGQIKRTEEYSVEYHDRRNGEAGTYELRNYP